MFQGRLFGVSSCADPADISFLSQLLEKGGFDLIAISLALIVAILYAISATVLQIGVIGVDPIDATFFRNF